MQVYTYGKLLKNISCTLCTFFEYNIFKEKYRLKLGPYYYWKLRALCIYKCSTIIRMHIFSHIETSDINIILW